MTQKLKDEEEIHKSRTSLHSILNTTDVAFALFNQDFETVTFNQRAADFASRELKVTLSEGLPLSEYVPLDKANLWGKIAPELIMGMHFEFERSYEQAPGKFHWYQIKLLSVTESGVFLGLVASIYDITDRKEDEMHREKITGDLLQRNQDLEQFTYIVSHNLRAPVANIMGICSILKNDNLQHDARLNLEKILTVSVTQLDTVIRDLNQILQVSREISEKNELVIFGEIVENIKSSIPSLIEKEEVQIITDFSEAEGFTTLKTYIYSIFYNLIMNSIKFRKFGQSPVIKISSGQEGQEGKEGKEEVNGKPSVHYR